MRPVLFSILALCLSAFFAFSQSITGTWIAHHTTPDGRETICIELSIAQAGTDYVVEVATSVPEWPRISTDKVQFDGLQLRIGEEDGGVFFRGEYESETIKGEARYGDFTFSLSFSRE